MKIASQPEIVISSDEEHIYIAQSDPLIEEQMIVISPELLNHLIDALKSEGEKIKERNAGKKTQ